MRFDIEPYEGPIPLRFGASEAEVVELLGEPRGKSTNFRRERIFDYDHMNVGFGKDGNVIHVGFLPEADVVFQGRKLFERGTFEEILKLDGTPMEVVGFVVLLNLGIAFSGFHDSDEVQKAVTVFVRGTYDRLKGRMKSFLIR
jgi:hypothetical protein